MRLWKKAVTSLTVTLVCVSVHSCTSFQAGPSDEELVQQAVRQFARGFNEKNGDLIAEILSEDFTGLGGEGKTQAIDFLSEQFKSGSGPEMDLSEVRIQVDGAEATASPVFMKDLGSQMNISLTLRELNGQWLIIRTDLAN